jgi:tRNA-modifying protein YgfZ
MTERIADVSDPAAEYAALTGACGVVDLRDRSQVELRGSDRASFLHNLCSNEIRKLPVGAGNEAFFLDAKGHIVGHGLVFARADSLVIDTVPGAASGLARHLDRYLIREKVELLDRSDAWGDLFVAGATAEDLLGRLISRPLPSERLAHIDVELAGRAVSVCRVDFTRAPGFLVRATAEDLPELLACLHEAGAAPCGALAFEQARIEAGTPFYGRDITEKNLPQEVGRDALAISFVKGCYIGQETVARLDALGHVNKTLVGVRFSGTTIPETGLELSAGGQSAGQVTSAALSPQLQAPLALAYIRRSHSAPGSPLESSLGPAEVIALPV